MVSIAELLDWKPESLGDLADQLFSSRRNLVRLQDEIDTGKPPVTWQAPATESANKSYGDLKQRLADYAAQVSDLAVSVEETENEVKAAKRQLQDALNQASGEGFTVNHATGEITAPEIKAKEFPDDDAAQTKENARVAKADGEQDRKVRDIKNLIEEALERAEWADVGLAKAMDASADYDTRAKEGSTLADAIVQLPPSLEKLSDKEIAEKLGGEIALETISAYLNAEVELATWEVEGAAKAEYKVMADGTVRMLLHLEAGLGREVSVGGAEADVSGGGTTDLDLAFKSPEEAQKFLDNLDDKAFDLKWYEYGNAPAAVATNVADYIQEQDIRSFKTGIYGKASAEFDAPWARGEAEGRVDGYYDWKNEEFGVKVSTKVEAELGSKDSGYGAGAEFAGEVKVSNKGGEHGNIKEFNMAGKLSGTVANEKLGIDLPATSSGAGVDVELKMDDKNLMWNDMQEAIKSGDMGRATDIAMDHGQVVVRQTTTEQIASEEHNVDIKVAEVEVEAGASAESADNVWVREANGRGFEHYDPTDRP
ncbi:hypothetical protein FB381_0074 [Nocardioides albertanoniae]|uniref:Uncharacterized protein n=1 Tax=Nocardioides albertanoniae TaxID=1175486 RepID=A0A543A0W2_9ACTN|nr:hypothetical protein [Nocardioides albertanoniae]TQL66225.1 hypothetical protein FB381_0074 [Nocardioides albertanoniae]